MAFVPNSFGSLDVVKDLIKRVFGFYTLPKMEKDRALIVGSMMFHYGIWVVLISHLGLIVPLPITAQVHDTIGLYVGGAAGFVTLGGMIALIVRKGGNRSHAPGQLLRGLLRGRPPARHRRVRPRPDPRDPAPDYLDTVSPWLVSILALQPNLNPIASVGLFTILHVTLALVFIAYIPWGRMAHMVAYLFNPTVTGPSFPVVAENLPSVPVAALVRREVTVDDRWDRVPARRHLFRRAVLGEAGTPREAASEGSDPSGTGNLTADVLAGIREEASRNRNVKLTLDACVHCGACLNACCAHSQFFQPDCIGEHDDGRG